MQGMLLQTLWLGIRRICPPFPLNGGNHLQDLSSLFTLDMVQAFPILEF